MDDMISFDAGTRLQRNGQVLVSYGCAANGRVKLTDPNLRTTYTYAREKLEDAVLNGRIVVLARTSKEDASISELATSIPADLSTYDLAVQKEAHRKLAYVRAVRKAHIVKFSERTLKAVIEKTAKALDDGRSPSWRTLIRWIKRFEKRQVTGLIDVARGNAHSRLDDQVEDLIYIAITFHYMKTNAPALKDTHLHLKGVIEGENKLRKEELHLLVPSYKALLRRLQEFDPFELMCARLGRQHAVNWARTRGMAPRVTRVLEIVQMDHTIFDAEVVFKGVLRLGKPTLSIARDQFSGAIVGLYLGFERASYQSVMECLLCTVLPKGAAVTEGARLIRVWGMYGTPETLVVDNGSDFKGHDLKNACTHLGIDLQYCPPRKPWFKPHVERLFGILRQQFTNRLKGRTFTPREEKGDRNVDDEPLVDLDDLRRILIKWVVDFFNERPYGPTGVPPRVTWERSVIEHPVSVSHSEDEVRVYCGRTARRSLRPYGIEMVGLIYGSDALSALRRYVEKSKHYAGSAQEDRRVLIKYDPRDLGRIWVLDPFTNEYISAPAINREYATGLSMHRHRLNVRYARYQNKGAVDAAALVQASAEIDRMMEELTITDAERLGSAFARAIRNEAPENHDIEAEMIAEDLEPSDAGESPARPAKARPAKKPADAPCLEPAAPEVPPASQLPTLTIESDLSALASEWTT